MKDFFKLKPLKKEKLSQKFVISFALSSLIPLLLFLYVIYIIIWPTSRQIIDRVQLMIFLIVCISIGGYFLNRKIINSILEVVKNSKAIAEGDLSRTIKTEELNEIGELSDSFNRVTRRLRQNIEELKESKTLIQDILSRVGSAVTSFQDIDSLLELIVQTMTNALEGASGVLTFVDEKKGELYIKVASGVSKDIISKTRIKIDQGPIGYVVRNNRSLLLPNSEEGAEFDLATDLEQPHHSFICVPLAHANKVIGTLAVNDKKQGEFTEDDLSLLSNLAGQTAIAVENAMLNQDAEQAYFETIAALAMAVEAKDPYTKGHSRRVSDYSVKLAKKFDLSDKEIEILKQAAMLHDIGKIGIADAILRKPGPLTAEEYEMVKEHPVVGESILKPVKKLSSLCDLVRHHQEWINGEGYPDGLRGKDMSLSVKILMLADSFDAMTSDRPYRKALSFQQARAELARYSGTHFDKQAVDTFLEIIRT